MYFAAGEIEKLLVDAKEAVGAEASARFFADKVIPAMQRLRAYADEMELNTAKKYWPSRHTASSCSAYPDRKVKKGRAHPAGCARPFCILFLSFRAPLYAHIPAVSGI